MSKYIMVGGVALVVFLLLQNKAAGGRTMTTTDGEILSLRIGPDGMVYDQRGRLWV